MPRLIPILALSLLVFPLILQGQEPGTLQITGPQYADGVVRCAPGERAQLGVVGVNREGRSITLERRPPSARSSSPEVADIAITGSNPITIIVTCSREGRAEARIDVGTASAALIIAVTGADQRRAEAPATTSAGSRTAIARSGVVPVLRDACLSRTGLSSDQPCIHKVMPDSVAHRMTVLIRGTGFAGTRTDIGGAQGPTAIVGDTLIRAVLTEGTQNGNIVVKHIASGKSHTATVKLIAPKIVDFTPKAGRAGDKIIISGYGFADGGNSTAQVSFRNGQNMAASSVVDGTGNLINAYVPAGDATGVIAVGGTTGFLRSQEEFIELPTIDAAPADVTVPTNGTVNITGKALQNITAVVLGSHPGTITSKVYNRLSFTLPAPVQNLTNTVALGRASFTHRAGGNTSAHVLGGPNITVVVPAQITALEPDSGVACSSALIKGVGLSPPAGVTFQPVVHVNNVPSPYAGFSTHSSVSFIVPQVVTTGPVRLKTYGGEITSPTPFRVVPPAPTVHSGGLPSPIRTGSVLRFNGRLREVTKVTFSGGVEMTSGWTVAPIINDSSCQDLLQITVPPGATSGPVTFTNPRGSVSYNLTITP